MLTHRNLLMACFAALLTLGLAACGGGGDGPAMTMTDPDPDPPVPTAFEAGLAAINAATTAADADAAYADVDKTAITGAEAAQLQTALNDRKAYLAMAARVADQIAALMTAEGAIDTTDLSTQALVDAARQAIADLRQALDDAVDVSDADKATYQTALNDAVAAVDAAQGGIDTATRRTNQMMALSDASDDLQAALADLSGTTPTQALLDAANNALTALNTAIADAADLTDDEKAPYQRESNNAGAPIQTAQTAFDNAEDDAEKARIAAMAVLASKLHAGIAAMTAVDATPEDTIRFARHAIAADTARDGVNDGDIVVANGVAIATAVALSEDEDATVAALHGWTGQMFTAPRVLAPTRLSSTRMSAIRQ